jgi:hypothetical protein
MKLKGILLLTGGLATLAAAAAAGLNYLDEKQQAAQAARLEQQSRAEIERRRAEEKASTFGLVKLLPEPAEAKAESDSHAAFST